MVAVAVAIDAAVAIATVVAGVAFTDVAFIVSFPILMLSEAMQCNRK